MIIAILRSTEPERSNLHYLQIRMKRQRLMTKLVEENNDHDEDNHRKKYQQQVDDSQPRIMGIVVSF